MEPPRIFSAERIRMVQLGMWILMIGCVLLQRFIVPVGDTQGIPISLFAGYVATFFMLPVAEVNSSRLMLFCVSGVLALLTSFIVGIERSFSSYSLFELLITYAPFIFVINSGAEEYKRHISPFQWVMVLISVVALVQFVTQSPWDPIDQYLGKFTLQHFNTRPVLEYGSTFRKSNGLFLLEPSYLSQMAAIAITLELLYFKRIWRLGLYVVALCCSVSLSGVAMLSVVLAAYAFRYKKVPHIVIVILATAALMWAFRDNEVVQSVLNRKDELTTQDTSGWNRFVAPLYLTAYFVKDLTAFVVGIGAGNSSPSVNVTLDSYMLGGLFAPLKLLVEYGIFTLVAGCMFLGNCFFSGTRSYILSAVLFIFYTFMNGALLEPYVAYLVLALISLYPAQSQVPRTLPRAVA